MVSDSVWSPAVILRTRVIGLRWGCSDKPTTIRRRVLKLRKLETARVW